MICPECATEYRDGFTRCSDCDVDLVHELPPEEHAGPVKVFETDDPSETALVESLLRGAEIPFEVRNRYARQSTFAHGPVAIWVRSDDAEDARALIEGMPIEEA